MEIAALTSRPLGKVETYIGDDGQGEVDLIMTNEQMEQNFGVTGYQTVSISLKEDADAAEAADALRSTVSGISRCVVRDYTAQIEAQNLYLDQQIMFFYGIAAVLLGISLLHIVNSMHYLVAERKHEFSILRSMGHHGCGLFEDASERGIEIWNLCRRGSRGPVLDRAESPVLLYDKGVPLPSSAGDDRAGISDRRGGA